MLRFDAPCAKRSHQFQFKKVISGQRQSLGLGLEKVDEDRNAVVVSSFMVRRHDGSRQSLAADRTTSICLPHRSKGSNALSTNLRDLR